MISNEALEKSEHSRSLCLARSELRIWCDTHCALCTSENFILSSTLVPGLHLFHFLCVASPDPCLSANTQTPIGACSSRDRQPCVLCRGSTTFVCVSKCVHAKDRARETGRRKVRRRRLSCDPDIMWTPRRVVLEAADGNYTLHKYENKNTQGHRTHRRWSARTHPASVLQLLMTVSKQL